MSPGLQRKCNRWGNIGFTGIVCGLMALGLFTSGSLMNRLGVLMLVASWTALLVGCWVYADAKGYPRILGMVGITGVVGWLIIHMLPNRRRLRIVTVYFEPEDTEYAKAA